MKQIALITILVLFCGIFAQIQWDEAGIPVRQGVNIEWFRSSAILADGSIVYTWSDTRRGDRDIWAQRIDLDGNALWGENSGNPDYPDMKEGILINGEINRQEDIVAIHNEDNEIIFAWVDFRNNDAGDIYAQKLDSEGNLMWDSEGVPLCLAEDIQISLNIVNDANGGAYVIWIDSRYPGGTDIYGTHILSDGSFAAGWEVDGNPIANETGAQNQHTFWEDGTGGAIMAWHDERNPDDENIYAQRIAPNGDLLWETGGVLLCAAAGPQENVKMTPTTDGNFIACWRDKRSDFFGDIYAQKLDLNGNLLWATGVEIYTGDGIQRNPRITETSDSGAVIAWEDGRYDYNFKDIFAQKLDTNGNKIWDIDGLEICVQDNDQLNPRLNSDGQGGCWLVWDDGRVEGHPHEDIYLQNIAASGDFAFEDHGRLVCDALGEQFAPLVKINGNDRICISWGDNRTGSTGIYIQLLDSNGNELLTQNGEVIYYGLSGDAVDYKFIENGDHPIIVWRDTRNASIATQIFMQVLNPDGSFELEDDGQAITQMTGYDQEFIDVTYFPGSNIIGVVWEENRADFKQIYAQGVDLEGNFVWSEDYGLIVGEYFSQQVDSKISVVDNGRELEYFIGWSDFRENWDFGIYAQKIVNGELQWGDEGITIADADGDDKLNDLVEDYFIWQGGSWDDQNIFVKRVDSDGNTASGWPEEGLHLCDVTENQEKARGMIIPEGLFVVWQDLRNGDYDIYGQIITPEGNILWPEDGLALSDVVNDQTYSNFFYDGNIRMIWQDFRSGTYYDVYMQGFDTDGNELLTEGGLEVIATDNNQESPYLASDGENYIVFWEDYTSVIDTVSTESNLLAQKIDPAGNLLWDNEGYVISDDIKNQNDPLAVHGEGNIVYVIWEDTRSSGKTDIYNIYAQKIDLNVANDDNDIPFVIGILNQNYPNPFNPITTISFNLQPDQLNNPLIKIYNLKGQLVRELIPETNSVIWEGKDTNGRSVANGVYLYRLQTDDFSSATRKMLLLK